MVTREEKKRSPYPTVGNKEAEILGKGGLDLSLLEHGLYDPDGVRILRVAPGKRASVFVVPAEESTSDLVDFRCGTHLQGLLLGYPAECRRHMTDLLAQAGGASPVVDII